MRRGWRVVHRTPWRRGGGSDVLRRFDSTRSGELAAREHFAVVTTGAERAGRFGWGQGRRGVIALVSPAGKTVAEFDGGAAARRTRERAEMAVVVPGAFGRHELEEE